MKRKNPPVKSPLMKILTESIGNNGGAPKEEVGEDQLQLDSIGCTANVLLCDFKNRKLIVANAGDSRCVMGKGGKCVPLSFDHKPEC
jgi:serine/threonine protein phosphatase PrpC